MNITKENKDELNAVITINITEEDYEPRIDKVLKDYRRKAQIKGFRPGKAPLGLVRKMIGDSAKMQEIDTLISESLSKYLVDEKINIFGQPLPSKEQKPIDIEKDKEYSFLFDIGMAPEFELSIDNEIKIPCYSIEVDEDTVNKEIERYQSQFGKAEQTDISEESSYLKGDLKQVDEKGEIIEEGIASDNTMIAIEVIKDEDIKKTFIGQKKDAFVNFDIKKAYPNDTEIAGILKIEKEAVAELSPNFQYEIKEITTYKKSDLNQGLFDKVFSKDIVKSEEEFKNKISEGIKEMYNKESDFRFVIDARDILTKKTDLPLPEDFLKRWLKTTDKEEKYTDEIIEKEFPPFGKDLQWQLIKDKIAKEQEFDVTEEDLREESKLFTEAQFRQYGMSLNHFGEDQLATFIDKNLEKEEDRNRFAEKVIENKAVSYIKETVKSEEKKISLDDFKKLYEQEESEEKKSSKSEEKKED